ncbi:MAG: c-type cytochrome [Deltaproteobacteria bacterium]|nr:c-type cytochrome [Deltaproteobacteria bacterium]
MKSFLTIFLAFSICACSGGGDGAPSQQSFAALGRKIFFDTNLSNPGGVACATCHSAEAAFSDPRHLAVSPGAVSGTQGTRNAPTIMYSLFSPAFGFSDEEEDYIGGQFHDGAALDLEQQAMRPFFRHVEMNLTNHETLRQKVASASYASEFSAVFGEATLSDAEQTLIAVASAIAAFENSQELQPFSSKYDAWAAGQVQLTDQERRGMELFNAPNKGNCAACHPSTGDDGSATRALFTDFTYDNVGLPANKAVNSSSDLGLYANTGRPSDVGRFKVPTLRNVAVTAPYFHHGLMKTLKEAVHFYNARDIDSSIGTPEFAENMNILELGNLGLTDQEEEDIVAFLNTLTDGYTE